MTGEVFGGKYVAAIATAKSAGAKQTVDYLAQVALGGVFAKARVWLGSAWSCAVEKSAGECPEMLEKAHRLGREMVADFQRRRTFPWQKFFPRLLNDRVMRPMIAKGIAEHAGDGMRGVYASLKARGLIASKATTRTQPLRSRPARRIRCQEPYPYIGAAGCS